MVENNLRNSSTVRQSSDEDWTVELRSLVEVKFYWVSHGRRGRTGRSILEIGEVSNGLIGIPSDVFTLLRGNLPYFFSESLYELPPSNNAFLVRCLFGKIHALPPLR